MNKIIISDDRGYRGPTHFAKTRIYLEIFQGIIEDD